MKTTKEMIEVMQAFEEGKEIETIFLGSNSDGWIDDVEPTWDWGSFDYRIKPEPKKRPMTFEEIVAYWKEHRTEIITCTWKDEDCYSSQSGFITGYNKENEFIYVGNQTIYYDNFIMYCIKEDGSRFEVEE